MGTHLLWDIDLMPASRMNGIRRDVVEHDRESRHAERDGGKRQENLDGRRGRLATARQGVELPPRPVAQ